MLSVVVYDYQSDVVDKIGEWGYGTNWPAAYIIYNDKKAYVGQTFDAVKRTSQHLKEPVFNDFTSICLISNNTYNKSVVLDLESFLIKYIDADGGKSLTNMNVGLVDHNYFYREAYEDDFKAIWDILLKKGIVQKSLLDIENSELFKYSPYKTLNAEQEKAAYEILRNINKINNATKRSIINVIGGAGTGKTILAVYLVKLLQDIASKRNVWRSIEDPEDSIDVQNLSKQLKTITKIGFVVPMQALRATMKTIFNHIDGLSESMVLAPEDVVKSHYDVLIVDEAHRLYKRRHIPGNSGIYDKFDEINRSLMGDEQTHSESDLTELDWIIQSSRIQVLFYDEFQAIRVADIGPERFKTITDPLLFNSIELHSQMRCKGGNGYYEYIKSIVEGEAYDMNHFQKIDNYDLKVFDSVEDMISAIEEKRRQMGLCRIVAGPGWAMNQDIIIDGNVYHWAKGKRSEDVKAIYSIHRIQGFDLNYAGVIFGKEVYYDIERKRMAVNKTELRDNFTKSKGEAVMLTLIRDMYTTLMTRGIEGTYVYACDKDLRNYLRMFLDQ